MENFKNEHLVIEGNSFYEIDLQCIREKQKQLQLREKNKTDGSRQQQKGQRD